MDATEYAEYANSKLSPLAKLWTIIRQWIQPYYRNWSGLKKPTEKKSDKKVVKPASKKKKTKKKSKKTARTISRKELQRSQGVDTSHDLSDVGESVGPAGEKKAGVRIMSYSKPLDKAINFRTKPAVGSIYSYTSPTKIQAFAHFAPQAGFAYQGRNDGARKKLKPLVFPDPNAWGKPFDRTHLIPVGFHGSESDSRLLIGWDSDQNRGPFNDFEKKQKKLKHPIYWLASVTRLKGGARWEYKIYNADTGELVDELTEHMKCPFVWRIH